MSDTSLPPPEDKTPRSYATEPPRHVDYATLPPDVTLRPATIELKHNIFVVSVATMVFISLILFYIPLFNALLAGVFGGYHAGRMKRALGAALAASVMTPAILWFASFLSEQPELHFLSGLGFKGWVALNAIGMFIGAASGAVSRPIITERNLARYASLNAAPSRSSADAPEPLRSETPVVPPSGPEREV